MSNASFRRVSMTELSTSHEETDIDWLWHGLLAPGNITLLTSQWKAGKTTLLTGLLRGLEQGGSFLGRSLKAGQALVVSEETRATWKDRLHRMPVGPHAELLARPFNKRPTAEEWNALVDDACMSRLEGKLDLFVVDPMIAFLPGAWESNPGLLVDALEPLHRLTSEGAAVLLLHHPRKEPSDPGHSARGTGALLGYVDIALELSLFGRLRSDIRRRQVTSLSRYPQTPERLVYEWDPSTGAFTECADPVKEQFERNWAAVVKLLERRTSAVTHKELLEDWPDGQPKPAATVLYGWLNRAFAEGKVRRDGNGTRPSPWRYSLETEADRLLSVMPSVEELMGFGKLKRR